MSDDQLLEACRRHGAKTVADAARDALRGRRDGLVALGLGSLTMAAAYRATVIAAGFAPDAARAVELVSATPAARPLPPSAGPAPPPG